MFSIEEIASSAGGSLRNPRGLEVGGFSIDSRSLSEGDFFIALPGEETDGHLFLDEAFEKGASGALIHRTESVSDSYPNLVVVEDTERALRKIAKVYRSRFDIPIIGVTGSWGKTSTKTLIQSILSVKNRAYCSPGNYNTEYGLPLALLEMPRETDFGIFELGVQYPGDMEKLCRILSPTNGIVTGVGHVHGENFDGIDHIAREKCKIGDCIPEDSFLVLNGDCERLTEIEGDSLSLIYYNFRKRSYSDYWIDAYRCLGLDGSKFSVCGSSGCTKLRVNLLGRGNAYNVLGAASMSREMGVSFSAISRGVQIDSLPQRLDPVSTPYGVIVDDTYNANPKATEIALDFMNGVRVKGKKILVLGDMLELGDYTTRAYRGLASAIVNSSLTQIYTCGPVSRQLHDFLSEKERENLDCYYFRKKENLIPALKKNIDKQSNLVLVKGSRAMAMEEVVQSLVEQ